MSNSRRSFLKTGLASAAIASTAPALAAQHHTENRYPIDIKLGIASYSLRKFNRAEAIAMVQALGLSYVNIKSFHLRHEETPEKLIAGRREIEAAGLQIDCTAAWTAGTWITN